MDLSSRVDGSDPSTRQRVGKVRPVVSESQTRACARRECHCTVHRPPGKSGYDVLMARHRAASIPGTQCACVSWKFSRCMLTTLANAPFKHPTTPPRTALTRWNTTQTSMTTLKRHNPRCLRSLRAHRAADSEHAALSIFRSGSRSRRAPATREKSAYSRLCSEPRVHFGALYNNMVRGAFRSVVSTQSVCSVSKVCPCRLKN